MSRDIEIEDKQESKPQTVAKAAGKDAPKKGYVRIMIPKTKTETRDVFVSFNFVPYQIKRGVPVDVPEGVVTALELAQGVEYTREVDPLTQKAQMVAQTVMSYPFQRLAG